MLSRRYHKIIYVIIVLFLGITLYSCKSPSQIKNKSPVTSVNTTKVSANKTITQQSTVKNNATKVATNSTLPKKHILKTNSTISENSTLSKTPHVNATNSNTTKIINKSKINLNSSKTKKVKNATKEVTIIKTKSKTKTNNIKTQKLAKINITKELNKTEVYKKHNTIKKINKSIKEKKKLKTVNRNNNNTYINKPLTAKKHNISKIKKVKFKQKAIATKKKIKKETVNLTHKKIAAKKNKSRHVELIAKAKIEHKHKARKIERQHIVKTKEKEKYLKEEKKYKENRERYNKNKRAKSSLHKSKEISHHAHNTKTVKLTKEDKNNQTTNKINKAAIKSKITKKRKTNITLGSNNPNNKNEYIIGPGDVLDIEVWKEPQLSAKVPVRPDGKITLPLINDVQAAGRTPLELRAAIQKALSKYLENPVVSVSVLGVNKKFFILGKVNAPGEYPLNSPITVLQAIALAKGFADWADTQHIIILRQLHGKQIRLKFNYDAVAQGKDLNENIYLKPGDTIIVP